MSIEIDVSQPGIVFSKFDGDQTAEDVERYIEYFARVHAQKRPYVGINWMKKYTRTPNTAQRMGRWLKDTEAVTRELCAGAAIIAPTTFRFMLSAVFLVKPMVCPYAVCANFGEAERFVREQARSRNLKLAEPLRAPWPDVPA
jgi:hypothetical protein